MGFLSGVICLCTAYRCHVLLKERKWFDGSIGSSWDYTYESSQRKSSPNGSHVSTPIAMFALFSQVSRLLSSAVGCP